MAASEMWKKKSGTLKNPWRSDKLRVLKFCHHPIKTIDTWHWCVVQNTKRNPTQRKWTWMSVAWTVSMPVLKWLGVCLIIHSVVSALSRRPTWMTRHDPREFTAHCHRPVARRRNCNKNKDHTADSSLIPLAAWCYSMCRTGCFIISNQCNRMSNYNLVVL